MINYYCRPLVIQWLCTLVSYLFFRWQHVRACCMGRKQVKSNLISADKRMMFETSRCTMLRCVYLVETCSTNLSRLSNTRLHPAVRQPSRVSLMSFKWCASQDLEMKWTLLGNDDVGLTNILLLKPLLLEWKIVLRGEVRSGWHTGEPWRILDRAHLVKQELRLILQLTCWGFYALREFFYSLFLPSLLLQHRIMF